MTDALHSSFHAMSVWLQSQSIDPKDLTVVLRTKDALTRARLNAALNRWAEGLSIFQPLNTTSIVKPSPFECYGIKVNVSDLDASRGAS